MRVQSDDFETRETMKRIKQVVLFCCLSFPVLTQAQTNWLQLLPPPFESISLTVSTNLFGTVSTNAVDPEPNGKVWRKPRKINSYLHPGAAWEMRSYPVTGGHGHQACYDANGILITKGVAAGTADFAEPYSHPLRHQEEDVKPFIRALQLDGNPCQYVTTMGLISDLNRPMMYQGRFIDMYIERRPATPTGTRPHQ